MKKITIEITDKGTKLTNSGMTDIEILGIMSLYKATMESKMVNNMTSGNPKSKK